MSKVLADNNTSTQRLAVLLSKMLNISETDATRKLNAIYTPFIFISKQKEPSSQMINKQVSHDQNLLIEKKCESYVLLGNQVPIIQFLNQQKLLHFVVNCPPLGINSEKLVLEKEEFEIAMRGFLDFRDYFYKNRDFVRNEHMCSFIDDWLSFPVFQYLICNSKLDFQSVQIENGTFNFSMKFLFMLFLNFNVNRMTNRFLDIWVSEKATVFTDCSFPRMTLFMVLAKKPHFFEHFLKIANFLQTNGQ